MRVVVMHRPLYCSSSSETEEDECLLSSSSPPVKNIHANQSEASTSRLTDLISPDQTQVEAVQSNLTLGEKQPTQHSSQIKVSTVVFNCTTK